ncbi:MAG TPA: PhzF family phenazine biosynthesis protein [Candidatus Sulfotelmatobacter sp.]|nr:PhzF family phenazine biosynthesis protein [Candidatus Sulfotelmatobacter sp.]
MPTLHYRVVDVFTAAALEGNALAVFTDASSIDEKVMQEIAREMNLAETAFILPAEDTTCVARVRIFTPSKEMVFAGHPTIGTSFVLFDEGMLPQNCDSFVLQEKVGPVQVWIEKGSRPMIWLKTPAIREGKRFDRALCARALGLQADDLLDLSPQLLDAGNPTLLIALRNQDAVDRAWLDMQGMRVISDGELEPFCVFVFCRSQEGAYSRMFAPEYGVVEDPATGSSTGPLAAYMMKHGLMDGTGGKRFISEQGTKMKRRSLLHVRIQGKNGADGIYVGGHVTPIAECTMKI